MLVQALIVAVSYALAIVLVFMPSIPYDDPRFSLQRRALYAAAMAIYALFLTYSIACAIEGGCVSMSWVTVIAYAIVPCTVIFLYSLSFYSMERLRLRTWKLWNDF